MARPPMQRHGRNHVRVARRRPLVAPSPLGALLATAFAAATLVGIVVGIVLYATGGDSAAVPYTSPRMADAFGLGGLSSLKAGRTTGAPSPIEQNVVVSYYGSPRTPSMGILGEHDPE